MNFDDCMNVVSAHLLSGAFAGAIALLAADAAVAGEAALALRESDRRAVAKGRDIPLLPVQALPDILFFDAPARVCAGDPSVTLRWRAVNASEVTLNGRAVPLRGSQTVRDHRASNRTIRDHRDARVRDHRKRVVRDHRSTNVLSFTLIAANGPDSIEMTRRVSVVECR